VEKIDRFQAACTGEQTAGSLRPANRG